MKQYVVIKGCVIGIVFLLLGASAVIRTEGMITQANLKNQRTSEKASHPLGPTYEWIQQTKLLASDGAADNNFGNYVSLDGEYALIGASGDNDLGDESGSAYIFKRDDANWGVQQKILAQDGTAGDYFGCSVSLYGDYALIGAYGDDDKGEKSGSVYIFKREGTTWIQEYKIIAADGELNDYFGCSVSLYGDYALIGATGDHGPGGWGYGAAYIYKRSGSSWTQEKKIGASDGGASDYFGNSVSLNGEYALLGAHWDDDNGIQSGSAYVFKHDGTDWVQQKKLTASNAAAGDYFGSSVSLDGDSALIGAPDDADDFGYAYVFQRDGTNWIEKDHFTAADIEPADAFGIAVSLDGTTALIGSYGADEPEEAGSAYIFTFDGTSWNEIAKIDAVDETGYEHYGASVSLDGDYALIGAPWDSDQGEHSGSAYVFKSYSLTTSFLFGLASNVGKYGDSFMKCNPRFLFMIPSNKLLYTQGTIVMKNGYFGIFNEPLIIAIGKVAIIN